MPFERNGGGSPVYEPNSFGGPTDDPAHREPSLRISGEPDRWERREDNEDYQQAGDLYRLMSEEETVRLVGNIVGGMQGVPREIQPRQVRHFYKADPAYGEGVGASTRRKPRKQREGTATGMRPFRGSPPVH